MAGARRGRPCARPAPMERVAVHVKNMMRPVTRGHGRGAFGRARLTSSIVCLKSAALSPGTLTLQSAEAERVST